MRPDRIRARDQPHVRYRHSPMMLAELEQDHRDDGGVTQVPGRRSLVEDRDVGSAGDPAEEPVAVDGHQRRQLDDDPTEAQRDDDEDPEWPASVRQRRPRRRADRVRRRSRRSSSERSRTGAAHEGLRAAIRDEDRQGAGQHPRLQPAGVVDVAVDLDRLGRLGVDPDPRRRSVAGWRRRAGRPSGAGVRGRRGPPRAAHARPRRARPATPSLGSIARRGPRRPGMSSPAFAMSTAWPVSSCRSPSTSSVNSDGWGRRSSRSPAATYAPKLNRRFSRPIGRRP